MKVKVTTLLLLVFLGVLMLGSAFHVSWALSISQRMDKAYYNPGDSGKLLISFTNNELLDLIIFKTYLKINGIGVFNWAPTDIPEAPLPLGYHGYPVVKGATLTSEIPFQIPETAQRAEYQYSLVVVKGAEVTNTTPLSIPGSFWVVPRGEKPPDAINPTSSLITVFICLLVVYPIVWWRSKRFSYVILIGLVGALSAIIWFGGIQVFYAALNMITANYVLVIALAVIGIVLAVVIQRRRRHFWRAY